MNDGRLLGIIYVQRAVDVEGPIRIALSGIRYLGDNDVDTTEKTKAGLVSKIIGQYGRAMDNHAVATVLPSVTNHPRYFVVFMPNFLKEEQINPITKDLHIAALIDHEMEHVRQHVDFRIGDTKLAIGTFSAKFETILFEMMAEHAVLKLHNFPYGEDGHFDHVHRKFSFWYKMLLEHKGMVHEDETKKLVLSHLQGQDANLDEKAKKIFSLMRRERPEVIERIRAVYWIFMEE